MLLAVDIGNSNLVFGLFKSGELCEQWRLSTETSRTPDEYGAWLTILLMRRGYALADITAVIACSVVPAVERGFAGFCETFLGKRPLFVGREVSVDFELAVDEPAQLGADRLVNSAWAFQCHKSACIVIDMGTATTFDVVNDQGVYVGGAIAPGLELAASALFRSAAKLNGVDLAIPERAIGKNTKEHIQSGLILGYVGLIDALVARMKLELNLPAVVIATGGLSPSLSELSEQIEKLDPDLTLRGLHWIAQQANLEMGL